LASEKDQNLARLRQLAPEIPTSMSMGEVLNFLGWIQQGAKGSIEINARAIQIPPQHGPVDLAKPELIQLCHALGMEVHYWTINDVSEMRRLLANGADGIVSDRPWLKSEL
jgi:glycerophosphoryl diester phosphodiesterase